MILVGVVLVVCLVACALVSLRHRRPIVISTSGVRDAPAVLLAASVHLLAADRAEWGEAMVGELDRLTTSSERWRFALGCVRATGFAAPRRGAPDRLIVAVVAAAVAACVSLVAYALARYPGVIDGARTWSAVTAFLAVLAGYLVITRVIVHRLSLSSLRAVRDALFGAVTIAAFWMVVGVSASFGASQYIGTLLLVAVPLASLSVGAVGTRRTRNASTGRQAALLSALGAGLLVFLLWVGAAVLTAGRPYDAGMVRDFRSSGAHDLATYAVNDNLGAAMGLLLIVPMVAAVFGFAGASIAGRSLPRASA